MEKNIDNALIRISRWRRQRY